MPGKNSSPLIIADADALVALMNAEDASHERAKRVLESFSSETTVLFPTTAICEAVTILRSRLNKPNEAGYIVTQCQSGAFPLQAVDQEILRDAGMLFTPSASKKNTLFDAVVAVIAKKLNADAIFSFDGWYRKIGLLLANDFLEQTRGAV